MQASFVLANIYTSQVQKQLQAAEGKWKKGKKRLIGDGKAKFFTGDEFFTLCVEDEQRREEEEAEAKQRWTQREGHAAVLVAWKTHCDGIKEENRCKPQEFERVMTQWEQEKASAKAEGRRSGWQKPRWKQDFQPEKLPACPKRQQDESSGDDDDDDIGVDND